MQILNVLAAFKACGPSSPLGDTFNVAPFDNHHPFVGDEEHSPIGLEDGFGVVAHILGNGLSGGVGAGLAHLHGPYPLF